MEELIDFEELINLQLSLPSVSQSSQEPITDVLDKMCEAMDESNLAIDNVFKNEIAPDDIVDLDEFENLLATASLCNDESNLVTDDLLEINDNDVVNSPDDTIDLDEFESISANECLFIDNEDEIYNDNNHISNLQHVLSYEVPIEIEENARGHKTESHVIKEENVTNTNNYALQTIGVESTATSGEKEIENYIDLTFEFGTVNPVSSKLSKEYENGLETARVECKIETITQNIVTLTTNSDSNVKYEHGIERPKTDCKNNTEAITKDNNENKNSDSDYDPLDFEFISEQEACKAGIVTRISKVTINEIKKTVTNTAPSTSKNAESKLQTHILPNCTGQSTSNIDNRPRKNEASLADYVKYSKYRYQRCYARSASELHVIPEGERYLDMFRGEYAPEVVNNLCSLTNKRVLPAVAMAANFEELAYRDPGLAEGENEKYKGDAEDCCQKILSAYPRENRRKRRRH